MSKKRRQRASFTRNAPPRERPPKQDRYEVKIQDILTGKWITFRGTHEACMKWLDSIPDRSVELTAKLGHDPSESLTKERVGMMVDYLTEAQPLVDELNDMLREERGE